MQKQAERLTAAQIFNGRIQRGWHTAEDLGEKMREVSGDTFPSDSLIRKVEDGEKPVSWQFDMVCRLAFGEIIIAPAAKETKPEIKVKPKRKRKRQPYKPRLTCSQESKQWLHERGVTVDDLVEDAKEAEWSGARNV